MDQVLLLNIYESLTCLTGTGVAGALINGLREKMYGFPVASVSTSLYLVPRGYFTASQPSVNLHRLLAACLPQLSAARRRVEEHHGAMSGRNSPPLYSNKSTNLKYHPMTAADQGIN